MIVDYDRGLEDGFRETKRNKWQFFFFFLFNSGISLADIYKKLYKKKLLS